MRTSPWSAVVLVACAAFVIAAAWIRVHRLAGIDLFCDEALGSEIASSLWQHGELNPLRFSNFLPDHQLRSGIFVYFPPLSYLVAAPFTALRDRVGANLAPRLPALLSGLILIALLLPAGRAVFGDLCVGLGAAALTTCNWLHVGMSRSKNRAGAVADCLDLVSRAPAWVFMGDNYFHNGRLDACDELVRERGTLIMHSAPIASFTDPGNPLGYALYHLEAPVPRP